MKRLRQLSISLLLIILQLPLQSQNAELFFRAAGSPSNPKVQVSWNKYYTYDGITDICKKLAKEYPELVTMESAGKSYQGTGHYCSDNSDKKSR